MPLAQTVDALSVPSCRVEPLQLELAWLLPGQPATFSTLKPGRPSATELRKEHLELVWDFQYPQAGSSLCNHCQPEESKIQNSTFSTLKPGRPSATVVIQADIPHFEAFSTLKPGRPSATSA